MYKFCFVLASLSLLLGGCKTKNSVLVAGCGWQSIGEVDINSGKMLWSCDAPSPEDCNDIELTDSGDILYAYKGGARLIKRDKNIIWDYEVPDGCELYTATESKNGGYMLAMCGTPSRIVNLDKSGNHISELLFDTGIDNVHSQFRQILETDNSTYLIPLMGSGELVEMDKSGNYIKRINLGGTPFSVHEGSQQNTYLVSLGDAGRIVEVDINSSEIKRDINNDNIKGAKLLFVAELKMLDNGNIMVANWNGHVDSKDEPKLLEIDANNTVVKTVPNNVDVGNISAFYIY